MVCPRNCTVPLQISERQGIEIDYCPSCRGIWLDRGELDKIIERSGQYMNDREDSGYQEKHHSRPDNSSRSDSYDHRKPTQKRRSFLGELFDFD